MHPIVERVRGLGGGLGTGRAGRSVARGTAVEAFSLALAYGGGLWLHLLHEAEGIVQPGLVPSLLHWLRDSSLMLPLVFIGVCVALHLVGPLRDRIAAARIPILAAALVAVGVAVIVSVLVAVAVP